MNRLIIICAAIVLSCAGGASASAQRPRDVRISNILYEGYEVSGTVMDEVGPVAGAAVVEKGGLMCAGCVVNHTAHVMSCCQIDCGAVVASNGVVP